MLATTSILEHEAKAIAATPPEPQAGVAVTYHYRHPLVKIQVIEGAQSAAYAFTSHQLRGGEEWKLLACFSRPERRTTVIHLLRRLDFQPETAIIH